MAAKLDSSKVQISDLSGTWIHQLMTESNKQISINPSASLKGNGRPTSHTRQTGEEILSGSFCWCCVSLECSDHAQSLLLGAFTRA